MSILVIISRGHIKKWPENMALPDKNFGATFYFLNINLINCFCYSYSFIYIFGEGLPKSYVFLPSYVLEGSQLHALFLFRFV